MATALVRGLSTYPEQLRLLRAQPSLLTGAVYEAARWTTNVGYIMRAVMRPCTLAGCELRASDEIACIPEAVHQDPRLHPEPAAFIIQRQQRIVRSFGGGEWACLGQRLAIDMVALIGGGLFMGKEEPPAIRFTGKEVYGDNSFFRPPLHLYATCSFESGSQEEAVS